MWAFRPHVRNLLVCLDAAYVDKTSFTLLGLEACSHEAALLA